MKNEEKGRRISYSAKILRRREMLENIIVHIAKQMYIPRNLRYILGIVYRIGVFHLRRQ